MDDERRPQSNLRAQKNSLSRRSSCVKKKAAELAVLCDASLCLIQFDQEGQLNTFPEDASEVDDVLKRYLYVGDNVSAKQKVSGLNTSQGGGGDVHDEVDDELLDTKSALELLDFGHVLDVKMKQVEERIKLFKGKKNPEDKEKTLFYGDGTPFSPGDLQLSCKVPGSSETSSQHDIIRLAPSPHLSLAHICMGLAANDVMTDDNFCSTGCHSTNCSSCDSGIKKMNTNADGVVENMATKDSICLRQDLTRDLSTVGEEISQPLLKGDNYIAVKKQKTTPVQLFYKDGTPCSSDDLQMSINLCSSTSPSFCDHKGPAAYPTELLLTPFQSIEAVTNLAQDVSLAGTDGCM